MSRRELGHGRIDTMYRAWMPKDPAEIAAWDDETICDRFIDIVFHFFGPPDLQLAPAYRFLPRPVGNAYIVWSLWAEWCNGGLTQFLFNNGRESAECAAQALADMNQHEHAATVHRALEIYDQHAEQFRQAQDDLNSPASVQSGTRTMQTFSDLCKARLFEELEESMARFERNVQAFLAAYIRTNAEALRPPEGGLHVKRH